MAPVFQMAFMPMWWLLATALLGVVFGFFFCKTDS